MREKLNLNNNDDLDAEHSPESSKEPSLGTDEVVDREGYDLFSDLNWFKWTTGLGEKVGILSFSLPYQI